jgi:hypothetical protein
MQLSKKDIEDKKGFYRHFKNLLYELVDIAQHSETQEYYVVYKAHYGSEGLWVRPYLMFFETIERNGQQLKRFEYLGKTKPIS